MRLFGLTITKAVPGSLMTVPGARSSWYGSGWLGTIKESFTGAWQRNIEVESLTNITAFSAVYSCVSLIANDIAKLRIKLVEKRGGIWPEVESGSPFLPVLRKPNRYQTRIQFLIQWIVSLLLYGNTYVLKERDQRGVVNALYVLDPRGVTPLIAPDGEVYYRLKADALCGLLLPVEAMPASEIIHDRMNTLFHPLVGVTPIYACAASATQGIRIQNNSAKFFENMSRPSGHLSAPGKIDPPTQDRLKAQFKENYGGANLGNVLVTGDDMKYSPMTIPPNDAQLIEQQRWTVEDVARCFHVPLHKIGVGQNPTYSNIGALNQDYYTQTLQARIEAIELLLDEGLGLVDVDGKTLGTELDLEGLLRMDPKARAETAEIEMRSGTVKPNEAREKENRGPVDGGDTPYLQQQNFSLAALAKRDAQDDPFGSAKPQPFQPALPAPVKDAEPSAHDLADALIAKFTGAAHAFNQ